MAGSKGENMGDKTETVVKSACRMCHGICGVLVHMKGDRVVRVTGDPDCPTSNGYICPKGRASPELLYHPDRLKYPLKRRGERGENKWQRISWDEALDTISDKLLKIKREYGVESIAMSTGTSRAYNIFLIRFQNALGAPNRVAGSHICYVPRVVASGMTCGMLPVCDFYGFGGVYPKCVMVWGCSISQSGAADGMGGYQVIRAINRGARLIVIDPRRINITSKADHYLQIRPGTDDALALGMIHVIVQEGLYDNEFVERWTTGFDKLVERVQGYPPEKVEDITWIPAKIIKEAARLYATTKPACIQWGVSVDQNINNFQTARALLILRAITGNIDVPGGDVFWVPPADVVPQNRFFNPGIILAEKVSPEMKAKKIGAGKYRVLGDVHPPTFVDAVLSGKPYPIRAYFIQGNNVLLARSDPLRFEQALRKIDFIFASDLFMTPTTQLADIVLPAASWLEQDDIADMVYVWCVLARQKVAQIGECRDDKQIIIDLAKRMGLGEYFPWKDVTEYCNWILQDTGITFDEFKKIGILQGKMRYRKYEEEGFKTPSGKFELWCSALDSLGYDPLPYYVEPPESPYSTPQLLRDYPLIITTGARIMAFFHTEGRQIKSLRKINPDPLVEIHPDTASKLEIEDGDWVWIESPRGGKIRMKARLTSAIHPKVVCAQSGWWFPEKDPPEYGYKESNVNLLTADLPYDPHTGSESWRSFLCKISKAI